jgi:predicted nuclease with RNAse H fold
MRTVGVDLAAEPKTTAVAVVEWGRGSASVTSLKVNADDDMILHFADSADKVGIDCPLGWPDTFVRFLRSHHEGSYTEIPHVADSAWRSSLSYRVTDLQVQRRLQLNPLRVATDRIGLTAMRAARLQALLSKQHTIDRIGLGLLVEVYPAAALKHWSMNHRLYKGTKRLDELAELVGTVRARASWLDFGEHEEECRTSDHAIDAVISALIARAAALGHTDHPSAAELAAAVREGWIAVPTCSLDDLVTR